MDAYQAFIGQQQQVARGIMPIERILGGLKGEAQHARGSVCAAAQALRQNREAAQHALHVP